jgi:hypothetical protein
MALSDIISAIKTKVETAVPTAKVYGYERWSPRWDGMLALFKTDTDLINAWMITRIQTESERTAYDTRRRAHVFRLRGVYGLDDSENTEATFQAQIEAIDAAFSLDDETMGDAVTTIRPYFGPMSGIDGTQIDSVDVRMFGNVLCHYAELRLGVIE